MLPAGFQSDIHMVRLSYGETVMWSGCWRDSALPGNPTLTSVTVATSSGWEQVVSDRYMGYLVRDAHCVWT